MSLTLDPQTAQDVIEVGDVYKNRRAKPTSLVLIKGLHEDPKGVRVVCVQTSEGGVVEERVLHVQSLARMFPYAVFNAKVDRDSDAEATPQ